METKEFFLEELKPGDYVVYVKNIGCELGRVVSNDPRKQKMRVCYHSGCTASTTSYNDLLPLQNQYCLETTSFGYETFNPDGCLDYYICPLTHDICQPREVG